MAQRTVESHLSHAYRKLGVRSRTQLSRVYTQGTHEPNLCLTASYLFSTQFSPPHLGNCFFVPESDLLETACRRCG